MSDGQFDFIEDKTDGRLGRSIVWHDPKNREFPIRALLAAAPLKTRSHYRRHVFDQGRESSCTMQAAAGLLHSGPFRTKLARTNLLAYDEQKERFQGYRRSQRLDPWPGEHYDGTSTDAPFKMLKEEGRIVEYRWCFGLEDVLQTLSHYGPVSIGINWYDGMFETDSKGYIAPTGDIQGGHAVELYGINIQRKDVIGVNSWGPWGAYGNGKFRMKWKDLENLLELDGEAVTIVL